MLSIFTVSMSVCVWGGGVSVTQHVEQGHLEHQSLLGSHVYMCIYMNIHNGMLTMLMLFHFLFN